MAKLTNDQLRTLRQHVNKIIAKLQRALAEKHYQYQINILSALLDAKPVDDVASIPTVAQNTIDLLRSMLSANAGIENESITPEQKDQYQLIIRIRLLDLIEALENRQQVAVSTLAKRVKSSMLISNYDPQRKQILADIQLTNISDESIVILLSEIRDDNDNTLAHLIVSYDNDETKIKLIRLIARLSSKNQVFIWGQTTKPNELSAYGQPVARKIAYCKNKAIQFLLLSTCYLTKGIYVDFNPKAIFKYICSLDEVAQLTACRQALDPNTPLGHFFWAPRLMFKPSLERGPLKDIAARVCDLEAAVSTSSRYAKVVKVGSTATSTSEVKPPSTTSQVSVRDKASLVFFSFSNAPADDNDNVAARPAALTVEESADNSSQVISAVPVADNSNDLSQVYFPEVPESDDELSQVLNDEAQLCDGESNSSRLTHPPAMG